MDVRLVEVGGALGLELPDGKFGKPFFVDFLTASWRHRFRAGVNRRHIFRRALGATQALPRVCDATAGFGGDAVMALLIGCEVVALERSPLVAKVLRDGVERAMREDPALKLMFARLDLLEGDSIEQLRTLLPRPDVVFLDPMFDKPKKSAKSPKAMQILQELLAPGSDVEGEAERLFSAAWEACVGRVVVKRPLKAKAIRSSPTYSYKGQSIRYDVYVKA